MKGPNPKVQPRLTIMQIAMRIIVTRWKARKLWLSSDLHSAFYNLCTSHLIRLTLIDSSLLAAITIVHVRKKQPKD